ncbi:MAG TPA: hypothetical protein ENK20_04085 [Chromatiales bacterium]|nr:hypothetical protein [Chromatiales bacterium]
MRLTRRAWLALSGTMLAGGAGWLGWRTRGRPLPSSPDPAFTRALVDTLVPDDGAAPGALRLGIDRMVLERAARHRGFARALARVHAAVVRAGGAGFAQASLERRTALLTRAVEGEGVPRRVRRAFLHVRDFVMLRFYTDRRSWPSVGYTGPPQPRGYPDHTRPPRAGERIRGCGRRT